MGSEPQYGGFIDKWFIFKIVIIVIIILFMLYVGNTIVESYENQDTSCGCMPYGIQTKCFYECPKDRENLSWSFENNTCICTT